MMHRHSSHLPKHPLSSIWAPCAEPIAKIECCGLPKHRRATAQQPNAQAVDVQIDTQRPKSEPRLTTRVAHQHSSKAPWRCVQL